MTLILAAGGKGSRFSEEGCLPKQLAPDPVRGRPVIDHFIERLAQHTELERVIVAGSNDTRAADLVFRHLVCHPLLQRLKTEILLNIGPRKGVGEAFFRGLRQELSHPLSDLMLAVSDTVPGTFREFYMLPQPVLIGVTPLVKSEKRHTLLHVNPGGEASFEGPGPDSQAMIVSGIYKVAGEMRDGLCDLLAQGLEKPRESDIWNSSGEMRMTWAWKRLSAEGIPVGAANLRDMCEINTSRDLLDSSEFFSREYR